jgi:hypothetical protein
MRLLCQNVLLIAAFSIIACRDSSGPLGSREFVLHDINGRPLPTYLATTPGLTPTIVSSSLVLKSAAQAVITEHRIDWDGSEHEYTINYIYKITGSTIVFDSPTPCAPNALCAAPPKGSITPFGLTLDLASNDPGLIVYNYEIATKG